MNAVARPRFDHLVAMTDERGTFEHALLSAPRTDHGYCTDDMARVLVVAAREPDPDAAVRGLIERSVRFLADAQGVGGDCHNRMDRDGRWTDARSLEDCWGRSLWGFGTAVAHADEGWVRELALDRFARAARRRSPWRRSMAFAAVGAAEVLAVLPAQAEARALLAAAADLLSAAPPDAAWAWPEPTLTYANAVIPEAMIVAGSLLPRPDLQQRGLDLLGWLLDHETVDGHLSVTPAGGSAPGAARPAFDQQPIEVAALADACARAANLDHADPRWEAGVRLAVAWFIGDNDGAHVMWDPSSGGGYDGLHERGPNRNQGAESTLALLTTLQHARQPVPA